MFKQVTPFLSFAMLSLLVGCQHDAVSDGSVFPAEGTLLAPQRFADVQAASGARYDATLGSAHFSGDALNSLGAAKLDAMLGDDDAAPLTVYVNLPESAQSESRRAAVRLYLRDAGLRDEQIDLQAGVNPNTAHLASVDSAGLYESTETGLRNAKPGMSECADPAPAAMTTAR